MKIIADTHAHTLVSGHAYSTIREMAAAAAEKTVAGCTFAVDFSAGMWYSRARREQAGSYPG